MRGHSLRATTVVFALALSAFGAASCQSLAGIEEYRLSSCSSYCDAVMSNCCETVASGTCSGENAVYATRDTCMGVCAQLSPGDDSEPGAAENTVSCRFTAAIKAGSASEGELHDFCQQAGPAGAGVCGASECEDYCALYDQICPAPEYPQQPSCVSQCAGLRTRHSLNAIDDHEGDTLQCRLVHVSAATQDPKTHCPHARIDSTYCIDTDASNPPNCDDYCRRVTAWCTGQFAVYETEAQCKAVCKYLDAGSNGDTIGNTIGCRKYHAFNSITDPKTHCSHAGPSGGTFDHCNHPVADDPGHTTNDCGSYCFLAQQICSEEFAQKFGDGESSLDDCESDCADIDVSSTRAYSVKAAKSEPDSLSARILALSQAAEKKDTCAAALGE